MPNQPVWKPNFVLETSGLQESKGMDDHLQVQDVEFWEKCPGIGKALSKRIVHASPWKNEAKGVAIDWRKLARVKGIGRNKLESLRKCL